MNSKKTNILLTGGAGFIGSNLCEHFLAKGASVVCLDNLSTGHRKNIEPFLDHPNFTFIEGDIRDRDTCNKAIKGCNLVSHQAALGSVTRSIEDPITTNEVNIGGFVNVLYAACEAKVPRFVYAASSSTYGDSKSLPKVEHEIGKALSPYGITKYVNELYARNFSEVYGIETIGLRYFNVFGKRQDPNGAYAAVIPKFVKSLIDHTSPVINGDGSYSRDFTFIESVIQANERACMTPSEKIIEAQQKYYPEKKLPVPSVLAEVFNVAHGERTDLNQLVEYLKSALSKFDQRIAEIAPEYGDFRSGDIPHSLASIEKAKAFLGYQPVTDVKSALELACKWYYEEYAIRHPN